MTTILKPVLSESPRWTAKTQGSKIEDVQHWKQIADPKRGKEKRLTKKEMFFAAKKSSESRFQGLLSVPFNSLTHARSDLPRLCQSSRSTTKRRMARERRGTM